MMDTSTLEECIAAIINFSFSRSSGPGGQNVNKVNTKVTARVLIEDISLFTEAEKNRLRAALNSRINDADEIVIQVQDERSQIKNREIALRRIIRLITGSLKTKKKRLLTQPSKKAKERRLKLKKHRSELKKQRDKKQITEN